MKIIFLKWYKTWNPLLWLVSLFTWSKYCHCEIKIGAFSASATPTDGVRFLAAQYLNMNNYDEIIIQGANQRTAFAFLRLQKHKPYDWKGILLSQIFPLKKDDPQAWFCSELVSATLEASGKKIGIKPSAISPGKLYELLV